MTNNSKDPRPHVTTPTRPGPSEPFIPEVPPLVISRDTHEVAQTPLPPPNDETIAAFRAFDLFLSPSVTRATRSLPTKLRSTSYGLTALFYAATTQNTTMLTYLLTTPHAASILLRYPITHAILVPHSLDVTGPPNPSIDLLAYTLAEGTSLALLESKGKWGSVLHWAIKESSRPLLILALAAGASLDSRNSMRYTALHTAAYMNDVSATCLLLEHGADVGAVDGFGKRPFDIARKELEEASRREVELMFTPPEVIWLLLENGSVDWVDGEGSSVLHLAARYGHDVLVRDLLAGREEGGVEVPGVEVGVKDGRGRSALEVGMKTGQKEVVRILMERESGGLGDPLVFRSEKEMRRVLKRAAKACKKQRRRVG